MTHFKYLTMWPVYEELLSRLTPHDFGAAVNVVQNLMPTARFFDLSFPEWIFTVFSQGVLILTAIVMLWRRWRKAEAHLLGKFWAVGLFAWIQVLLLGNALPLVESGQVFPSLGFNRRFQMLGNWEPDGMEAVVMVGIYGLVALSILWVFTLMITPTEDGQLRGWRRARKLERNRLPFGSDSATAFWSVLIRCCSAPRSASGRSSPPVRRSLPGSSAPAFSLHRSSSPSGSLGTTFPFRHGWPMPLCSLREASDFMHC